MQRKSPERPTRADLEAAKHRTLTDLLAPNLRVLFCGINPGLYSAAIGHHFGRPGNRFWPTLHSAGFTPRLFDPREEKELLNLGYGITNLVNRATASADELADDEFIDGGKNLVKKLKRYSPRFLAVLGIGAYRVAFSRPQAALGLQPEAIGNTRFWVLPSPSGLNAFYYQKLTPLFRELHDASQ